MTVAVLVPVLRRPQNVRPLLDSLRHGTQPGSWRAVFIADPDDLEQQREVRNHDAQLMLVDGNYATKINAAVRVTREPLLFFGADDLQFHPRWLETATARMSDKVGVVGTNDLGNPRVIRGEHATHCLVARWYTDLGAIDGGGPLHEGYVHEFVDDEFVETAKHRGAFAHAPESIVEHLHPHWNKAPTDPLYDAIPMRMRQGRRIFRRRQRLWT